MQSDRGPAGHHHADSQTLRASLITVSGFECDLRAAAFKVYFGLNSLAHSSAATAEVQGRATLAPARFCPRDRSGGDCLCGPALLEISRNPYAHFERGVLTHEAAANKQVNCVARIEMTARHQPFQQRTGGNIAIGVLDREHSVHQLISNRQAAVPDLYRQTLNDRRVIAKHAVDMLTRICRIVRPALWIEMVVDAGAGKEAHKRTITIDDNLLALLVAERERHLRIMAGVPADAPVRPVPGEAGGDALMFPNPLAPDEGFSFTRLRRPRSVTKEFARKATGLGFSRLAVA